MPAEEGGNTISGALDRFGSVTAPNSAGAQRGASGSAPARALLDVTSGLLRAHTPTQVAAVIIKHGLPAIGADAGALVVTDWGERRVRLLAAAGFPESFLDRWRTFSLDDDLPLQIALRENRPIWLGDLRARQREFPEWAERTASFPYPSVAVLPLTVRDRPLGALALCYGEAGERSADERTFATLLGQQVAQSLDRARLYEAERGARVKAEFAERRIAFLADASERLASSLDPRVTLASVARLIVPEFADWVVVRASWCEQDVVAADHRDPSLAARLRDWEETHPPRPGDTSAAAAALYDGRTVLTEMLSPDQLDTESVNERHRALLRDLGTRSRLAVPVRVREKVVGAIVLGSAGVGRRYTDSDVAVAEDLAVRIAQAIDNAHLYESALSASEAKSNFLAVMSHELRTPLNAVLGYADLILMNVPEPIGERTRHQVERMRDAASRLLRLVEEVLRFARLEAQGEGLNIEAAPVAEVIGDSLALVEPMALAKGIELRVDVPDPSLQLETDAWKLRHVVSNLLANAVKFTDEGAVELAVRQSGDTIEILVRDTGIGIAAEHLERIFDPFWQAEQSATRRFGGTGLGLGVARELTRLIGGDIRVESTPGQGTTFHVAIPISFPGAHAA